MLSVFLVALLPALLVASSCPDQISLAVGSYTGQPWLPSANGAGVTLVTLTDDGLRASRVLGPADIGSNPSYCAFGRGPSLYCVNENVPGGLGRVSTYDDRIILSGGNSSTHVAVLPRLAKNGGERVVTANYGGSVSSIVRVGNVYNTDVYVVPEEFASEDEGQQSAPHPHMVLPLHNGDIVVPDLGSDIIWRFWIGARGDIHLKDSLSVDNGDGPRHAALGRNGAIYVVNELSLSVMHLRVGGCGKGLGLCGRKKLVESVDVDTSGGSAAAIRVSRDGRFLYASVRLPDTTNGLIVGFELSTGGGIGKRIGMWSSQGIHPRDFYIVEKGPECESYLAIVNRDSNNLVFVKRDRETGVVSEEIAHELKVVTPTSVVQIPDLKF